LVYGRNFLGHDPDDLADLLDDKLHAESCDWQDQAQLVIDVPGLRGTHAQLLMVPAIAGANRNGADRSRFRRMC
jgi:hypothetical protein